MLHPSFPRHCLVTISAVLVTSIASAQPAPVTEPAQPAPAAPEPVAPTPAAPATAAPPPTTPAATSESAPTAAPAQPTESAAPDTATATATPEALAGTYTGPDAPPPEETEMPSDVSPLLPPGEAEMFEPRKLSDNVVFTPGKGLKISSPDGDFSFGSKVRLQFMGTGTFPDNDSTALSVIVRRARIMFGGNVFGPKTEYKIELGFSPSDTTIHNNVSDPSPMTSHMMDFFFDFKQLRDLSLRVGQGKTPYNRQFVLSAGSLQLADLSLATNEFNLNRDAGVQLHSDDFLGLGMLRYALGLYSGRGRDAVGSDDTSLMYIGRAEVLPFGMFNDYIEADFERSMHPRLSIGYSYAFIDRAKWDRGTFGQRPTDLGTTDMHNMEVDTIFKIAGFSFLGEFLWRQGYRNVGTGGAPVNGRNGWGVTAQGGYLLPRLPLEIEARYSGIRGRGVTSLADSNELGGGLSWYFARHALKVQADYFRIWSSNTPGVGASIGDGAHRVRLQLTADL